MRGTLRSSDEGGGEGGEEGGGEGGGEGGEEGGEEGGGEEGGGEGGGEGGEEGGEEGGGEGGGGEGGGGSSGGDGAGSSMMEPPTLTIPVKSASELPDKMRCPRLMSMLAPCCTPPQQVSNFSGAMEEMSHRFKMQTPTPEYTCGKPATQSIQRGAGYKFKDISKGERTLPALVDTLVLVSIAVPSM